MLTKTCINPSCKKENPPDRIHCKFCGWKLPAAASDSAIKTPATPDSSSEPASPQLTSSPSVIASPSQKMTPQAEAQSPSSRPTVIRQIPPELLQPQATTASQPDAVNRQPAATVASQPNTVASEANNANQQLAADHAALTEAHQELTDAHQQLTDQHQQLQQNHQATIKENHTLAGRLASFEQEIARIPGLEQALALARQELDHLRSKPPAEVIKEVPGQISAVRQVLTWLVPIITAVGGAFAGVHTPLNTSKAQLDQVNTKLQQVVQQLNTALADNQHTKAAKAALEQQNGQLAGQLANESEQQAQQAQASQSSSAQLASLQRDLQATRTSLATTAAALQQAQREKSAAEQRAAQLQAESTRKGSQLDAAQNVISKHPLLNYHGPTEGNIIISYNAKNDKPANITIDHQHISGDGSLSINTMAGSMLPGVPVVVQASGTKRAAIVDSPGPQNGWAKLTIRVEGKDQHQAMVHWSVPQ